MVQMEEHMRKFRFGKTFARAFILVISAVLILAACEDPTGADTTGNVNGDTGNGNGGTVTVPDTTLTTDAFGDAPADVVFVSSKTELLDIITELVQALPEEDQSQGEDSVEIASFFSLLTPSSSPAGFTALFSASQEGDDAGMNPFDLLAELGFSVEETETRVSITVPSSGLRFSFPSELSPEQQQEFEAIFIDDSFLTAEIGSFSLVVEMDYNESTDTANVSADLTSDAAVEINLVQENDTSGDSVIEKPAGIIGQVRAAANASITATINEGTEVEEVVGTLITADFEESINLQFAFTIWYYEDNGGYKGVNMILTLNSAVTGSLEDVTNEELPNKIAEAVEGGTTINVKLYNGSRQEVASFDLTAEDFEEGFGAASTLSALSSLAR